MTVEFRSIVVSAEACELRRRLGPTAWVVVEELLAASSGPVDGCWSAATVRSLAACLGLSKDTVVRALARLRTAGIVTAAQHRTPTGTFGTGTYHLTIPTGITFARPDAPSPDTVRPRRGLRPTGSQLALSLD